LVSAARGPPVSLITPPIWMLPTPPMLLSLGELYDR